MAKDSELSRVCIVRDKYIIIMSTSKDGSAITSNLKIYLPKRSS